MKRYRLNRPDPEPVATLKKYKSGAIVEMAPSPTGVEPPGRGEVATTQSLRSRRRAAFAFGNAECDWEAMVTLTYDSDSVAGIEGHEMKRHLQAFLQVLRRKKQLFGWILEFSRRGWPHFHVFLSSPMTLKFGWREVVRNGQKTMISDLSDDGGLLVDAWQRIAGKTNRRFDEGGMIEKLRSPDAAARYVAKEAAKRIQKEAPDGWEWTGRFWGLSRSLRPRERESVPIWDFEDVPAYKTIFEKDTWQNLPKRIEGRPS